MVIRKRAIDLFSKETRTNSSVEKAQQDLDAVGFTNPGKPSKFRQHVQKASESQSFKKDPLYQCVSEKRSIIRKCQTNAFTIYAIAGDYKKADGEYYGPLLNVYVTRTNPGQKRTEINFYKRIGVGYERGLETLRVINKSLPTWSPNSLIRQSSLAWIKKNHKSAYKRLKQHLAWNIFVQKNKRHLPDITFKSLANTAANLALCDNNADLLFACARRGYCPTHRGIKKVVGSISTLQSSPTWRPPTISPISSTLHTLCTFFEYNSVTKTTGALGAAPAIQYGLAKLSLDKPRSVTKQLANIDSPAIIQAALWHDSPRVLEKICVKNGQTPPHQLKSGVVKALNKIGYTKKQLMTKWL